MPEVCMMPLGGQSTWTSRITNGCYSCRWKNVEGQPTTCCERFWWLFLSLVFLASLGLLYCWSAFSNDYDDFNYFVYENIGSWFGWSFAILALTCLVFVYLFSLLAASICIISKGQRRHLYLCHKIFLFPVLVICIGSYVAIDQLWRYEFRTVVISLQMTGPFLHIVALFVIATSSWLTFREIAKIRSLHSRIICVIGVCCFMLFVCLIPLAIKSPCLGHDAKAQSKPLLIAHRLGYVKTAPENTRMAYEQASSCNVFGVETDISISIDGVPFVMHDIDLLRTTNVAKVFPNRSNHRVDAFTWAELKELDAGSWFLREDPYLTVHTLSENTKREIRNQKILSLSEVARMIGNRSIIFDLRQPPYGHPFRENFTTVTMQVLLDSGLPQDQVLWLPSVDRGYISTAAPGFHQTSAVTSIDYLLDNNISTVNLEYNYESKHSIKLYRENNISTIQYVLSEPWLFSAAWCEGTTYVTTGDCRATSRLSAPIWTLTNEEYIAIWVCCDLVAVTVFVVFLIINLKRTWHIVPPLEIGEYNMLEAENLQQLPAD